MQAAISQPEIVGGRERGLLRVHAGGKVSGRAYCENTRVYWAVGFHEQPQFVLKASEPGFCERVHRIVLSMAEWV
jgi:hypothetical protein